MVPPGPIPNPEVKHQHVDGSRTTGPARVDSCQGKQSPQNESSAGFSVCGLCPQISTERSEDFDLRSRISSSRRLDFVFPIEQGQRKDPPIGKPKAKAVPRPVSAAAQLRRDKGLHRLRAAPANFVRTKRGFRPAKQDFVQPQAGFRYLWAVS